MPINLEIVKEKCIDSGDEFSILKMFNKAKTLKNRWDKDMRALISEEISFQEIIKFLAKHFKLKEAKDNIKVIKLMKKEVKYLNKKAKIRIKKSKF